MKKTEKNTILLLALIIGITATLLTTVEQRSGQATQTLQDSAEKTMYLDRIKIDNEQITFIHTNYLGSKVVETNAEGELIKTINYEPYGKSTNSKGKDYTGKTKTLSGTVNLGVREYDTQIRRFLVPDAIMDPQTTPYQYSNNNPYKYTDTNGLFAQEVITKVAEHLTDPQINKLLQDVTKSYATRSIATQTTVSIGSAATGGMSVGAMMSGVGAFFAILLWPSDTAGPELTMMNPNGFDDDDLGRSWDMDDPDFFTNFQLGLFMSNQNWQEFEEYSGHPLVKPGQILYMQDQVWVDMEGNTRELKRPLLFIASSELDDRTFETKGTTVYVDINFVQQLVEASEIKLIEFDDEYGNFQSNRQIAQDDLEALMEELAQYYLDVYGDPLAGEETDEAEG